MIGEWLTPLALRTFCGDAEFPLPGSSAADVEGVSRASVIAAAAGRPSRHPLRTRALQHAVSWSPLPSVPSANVERC